MNILLEVDSKKENLIKKLAITQLISSIALIFVVIVMAIIGDKAHTISDTVKIILLIILFTSVLVNFIITMIYGDMASTFVLKEYKQYKVHTDGKKLFIEFTNKGSIYEVNNIYKYVEVKEHRFKKFILKVLVSSQDNTADIHTTFIELMDIYTDESKEKFKHIVKDYYKIDTITK